MMLLWSYQSRSLKLVQSAEQGNNKTKQKLFFLIINIFLNTTIHTYEKHNRNINTTMQSLKVIA